jgi:hypothetical protein
MKLLRSEIKWKITIEQSFPSADSRNPEHLCETAVCIYAARKKQTKCGSKCENSTFQYQGTHKIICETDYNLVNKNCKYMVCQFLSFTFRVNEVLFQLAIT